MSLKFPLQALHNIKFNLFRESFQYFVVKVILYSRFKRSHICMVLVHDFLLHPLNFEVFLNILVLFEEFAI
jgi:hypothetical protein